MSRSVVIYVVAAVAVLGAVLALSWQAGSGGSATPAARAAPLPATNPPNTDIPGYDLANPISSFYLPATLREISALTDLDEHSVACVQDEVGSVFVIDVRDGHVVRELPFGPNGDYEGLTRVGDALWVLRSDGLMTELRMRPDSLVAERQVQLDIEHADIEGLGYDSLAGDVLVAPKSAMKGDKTERARRKVFRFDPAAGKRLDDLALDTSIDQIVAEAERAGITLPIKETKNGRERIDLSVRFASIAVHPETGQLFALSADDRALLVFARGGTLTAAHFFAENEMPKPEGITFLANGDMVIASEGVQTRSRVQVFGHTPR